MCLQFYRGAHIYTLIWMLLIVTILSKRTLSFMLQMSSLSIPALTLIGRTHLRHNIMLLTGDVNNTGHHFIISFQCSVSGWDIKGSKLTFCPQSWGDRRRINGQGWGFERLWWGLNCKGRLTGSEHLQNCSSGGVFPVSSGQCIYQKWSKEGMVVSHVVLVLIERCQNRECITVWCIWGCVPADQSEWPWKKVARSEESCFSLEGQVCVCCLPGEYLAPGYNMGSRKALWGSGMLCLESLFPHGPYFDMFYQPKHCCRPRALLQGFPWWLWLLSAE